MNDQKIRNKYTPIKSTKWSTETGNFTNNSMVKVEFSFTVISATKIVTCKFHMDESTAGRYNVIISRYLFTKLGIDKNLRILYSMAKERTRDVQLPWKI